MLCCWLPALIGPWLGTLADDPRQLLAGPGALVSGGASAPVEALADLVSSPGWPTWTVGLVAAPLLLAGLAGLLRNGPHARALLATWSIGLLGVAGALAAPLVTVTRTAEGPLRPWSGTGLLLVVLAAVSGALVAADGLRDRLARHGFGWRQLLVGPVAAAAALAPLVAAATWAWPGRPVPAKAAATSGPVLPAVALDAAQGPAALRTLVISGHQGEISYRLVGAEPGSWSRDLPPEPAAATSAPVTAAVQAMAAPSAGDGDAVTPSLRRLAIGFVIVDRTTPASVAARLDSAADLARLGSSSGRSVWRVVRPAGRVVIAAEGADEGFVVPSGAHATVDANLPGRDAGTPAAPGRAGLDRLASDPRRALPRTRRRFLRCRGARRSPCRLAVVSWSCGTSTRCGPGGWSGRRPWQAWLYCWPSPTVGAQRERTAADATAAGRQRSRGRHRGGGTSDQAADRRPHLGQRARCGRPERADPPAHAGGRHLSCP
jgi:hypothetical protein